MVSYDEAKREANIAKHGLDFVGAESIFDGPTFTFEDTRESYGEQRLKTLGILGGRVALLVWTERDEGPHLISLRYGEKHETQYFFQHLQC